MRLGNRQKRHYIKLTWITQTEILQEGRLKWGKRLVRQTGASDITK